MAAPPLVGAPCDTCGDCGFNPFAYCGDCGEDCTPVFDDFDRSDSASLGVATSGQAWVPFPTIGYTLASNAAAVGVGAIGIEFIDVSTVRAVTDAYYVEWEQVTTGGAGGITIAAVAATVGVIPTNASGGMRVAGAGVQAIVGTGAFVAGPIVAFVAGMVVRVTVTPSTGELVVSFDGVDQVSTTVSPATLTATAVAMLAQAVASGSRMFTAFVVGCL